MKITLTKQQVDEIARVSIESTDWSITPDIRITGDKIAIEVLLCTETALVEKQFNLLETTKRIISENFACGRMYYADAKAMEDHFMKCADECRRAMNSPGIVNK